MITYSIIAVLYGIASVVFGFLPPIDVLPYGLDEFLSNGMAYYRTMADFFPPFATMIVIFVIYLQLKLIVFLMKFFLGSRAPIL